MTPRRAFLLGVMVVAVIVAVVFGAPLVRPRGAANQAPAPHAPAGEAVAGGEPDGDGDAGPVQFYKDPKPLPGFTVQTLDGATVRTTDLKGKVLIVNFWATWCPPCRAEIPDLVALQEKYKDRLVVLGISMDETAPEEVRAFARTHQINYPVAMATPAILTAYPNMSSLPTSFIVDREGRVVQKYYGMLNAARTEREARVLLGLAPTIAVELIDADKPVGLTNASQLREVPGVELSRLTPARRGEALQALNEAGCTCGCGLSLALCRVDDPQCSVSLPLARKMVEEMAARR